MSEVADEKDFVEVCHRVFSIAPDQLVTRREKMPYGGRSPLSSAVVADGRLELYGG